MDLFLVGLFVFIFSVVVFYFINLRIVKKYRDNLRKRDDKINELTSEIITFKEKNKYLEDRIDKFEDKDEEIADLREKNSDFRAEITKLKTLLNKEREQNEEKINILKEAKEELKNQFELTANQIFKTNTQHLKEENRSGIKNILNPLKEQLGEFKSRIETIYSEESKDRTRLETQVRELKNLNERLNEEAVNLTKALKGDSKYQGTWGEITLERLLEESGLRKGFEYITQKSYRDETGKRLQPDVIIKLPEKREIIIDSKVSLTAYERFYSEDNEIKRNNALKQHIDSVKNHIKELSKKSYEDIKEINSLDYVLMFIPIEAAYLTAVEKERKIFLDALKKNILIVSPSTLLITLRTIKNIWQYEYQNRNAQEIARRGSLLYDKFCGFVDSMQKIGKNIDDTRKSYDKAFNQLKSGRGNLISQTEKLKKLGLTTKKNIDENLIEE